LVKSTEYGHEKPIPGQRSQIYALKPIQEKEIQLKKNSFEGGKKSDKQTLQTSNFK